MKIVGLTRKQLRRDVNEAGSSLALGRIQAVPSPVPAHTQGHTGVDTHRCTEPHTEPLPAQLCS